MDSLTEVAAAGDRAKSLAALRDFLASELVKCDGRGAAALAHEFRETLRELSAVEMPEGDAVDELAAERAKRRAGASA